MAAVSRVTPTAEQALTPTAWAAARSEAACCRRKTAEGQLSSSHPSPESACARLCDSRRWWRSSERSRPGKLDPIVVHPSKDMKKLKRNGKARSATWLPERVTRRGGETHVAQAGQVGETARGATTADTVLEASQEASRGRGLGGKRTGISDWNGGDPGKAPSLCRGVPEPRRGRQHRERQRQRNAY